MPALEILIPDDAVRNLIRQGKVEQIYTNMQTGSGKGMQTMEQALVDLVLSGVVAHDLAMSRSSRPQQLLEPHPARAGERPGGIAARIPAADRHKEEAWDTRSSD